MTNFIYSDTIINKNSCANSINMKRFIILGVLLTILSLSEYSTISSDISVIRELKSIEDSSQFKLKLNSFTEIPNEISGCGCYFSANDLDFSNKKYILVNDFAKIAYVSSNRHLVKLDLIEPNNDKQNGDFYLYSYKDFNLRIDITKRTSVNSETTKIQGVITLTPKKGKKQIYLFSGVCGC
jgi:hypothetical protein